MARLVAGGKPQVSRVLLAPCNWGRLPQFACAATFLPLFPHPEPAFTGRFRGPEVKFEGPLSYSLFKDREHMRKIIIAAAIAGAALSVAACSSNADNAASESSDSAMADANANADAAATAASEASTDAAAAASEATSAAEAADTSTDATSTTTSAD
jgi:hypothetical protein